LKRLLDSNRTNYKQARQCGACLFKFTQVLNNVFPVMVRELFALDNAKNKRAERFLSLFLSWICSIHQSVFVLCNLKIY